MITEDYCSFELSKLLKEKGFDEPCYGIWHVGNKLFDVNYEPLDYSELREERLLAPTHQMAMKWLRQKGIFVEITAISLEIITFEFEIKVIDKEHGFAFYPESGCNEKPTYEEAVDAAIHWTLENLL